ncbi:hypothetical protein SSPO_015460 [Streptomyces antimycoticus]|uniref:Uncharacterized protein n=1 Tax=Streptomyces antimycoticus TaxID=68175 RepID=A0A499UH56_9ACTN|nr:hypothetical protein [Streptomyces antimycoticus]BBJ38828.1 hypothetical protein SSPO_015460 [Streptomyces antimycoticus]
MGASASCDQGRGRRGASTALAPLIALGWLLLRTLHEPALPEAVTSHPHPAEAAAPERA